MNELRATSKQQQTDDATRIKELEDLLLAAQNTRKAVETQLQDEKDLHIQSMQDKENAHATVVKGKDKEIRDKEQFSQELQNQLDDLRATSAQQQADNDARIKELETQLAEANGAAKTLEKKLNLSKSLLKC